MGDIFTWCSTTSDAMAEWTSRFELAHFIGLKTPLKSKLNVVGRCRGRETEKCENRRCFPLYLNNQRRYGKLEAIIRFSMSDRSIYALKRKANDRWGMCYVVMGGGLKIGKIEKIGNGFACYGRTGGAMVKWTPRLDSAHQIGQTTPPSDILIADEGANRRGLKNRDIEDVFGCGGRINRDMANWRPPFDSARQIGQTTSPNDVLMVGKDANRR